MLTNLKAIDTENTIIGQIVPVYLLENQKVVKGRELYKALQVQVQFIDWIKYVTVDYNMAQIIDSTQNYKSLIADFEVIKVKQHNNDLIENSQYEYIFTIDVAKEIALKANNELGRIIRKYFIEVEKRYIEYLQLEYDKSMDEVQKAKHRADLNKRNSEYNKKVNKQLREHIKDLNITIDILSNEHSQLIIENKQLQQENEELKTNELILQDELEGVKDMLDSFIPPRDKMQMLNKHGFSVNKMYTTTLRNRKPVMTKSKDYINWLDSFLDECSERQVSTLGVDFSKPVGIWLYYSHLEKFDVTNFIKATIDALCLYFGEDDRNIEIMTCRTFKNVDTYEKGKTYFYIANIDNTTVTTR